MHVSSHSDKYSRWTCDVGDRLIGAVYQRGTPYLILIAGLAMFHPDGLAMGAE
jgi:hypothetical protein